MWKTKWNSHSLDNR